MGDGQSPIDATPGSLGLFAYDMFQYFSWWVYLGAALGYSAFVFTGELSKDGPLIFSKKNARSTQMIIGIHINFLLALLLMIRIACSLDPSLPDWMTPNAGKVGTTLDYLFLIAMMLVGFIERRMLYGKSKDDTHPTDHASE